MMTMNMSDNHTLRPRQADFAWSPLSSFSDDEILDQSFRRLTVRAEEEPEQDVQCPIAQLAKQSTADKKSIFNMADPTDVQRMRLETKKLL
mmetsp:Transcript_9774/g.28369  ORF Transcript_9774/g.28369 Transcript_9774/m.28369 type:complete len:91 (-) Transcript_9774:73-345(-)